MTEKVRMNDENARVTAPRQERRDAVENRARILAVARRLFAAQGVDATSMNQIAQAAQVGPGTLYRHFAHKGELCGTLLKDDMRAFEQRVTAIIDAETPESSLARLEQLLDAFICMVESHVPLLTAVQEAAAGERRFDVFQAPMYNLLHSQITRLLNNAIAQGEISEMDVDFIADAVLAATAPPLLVFQQQYRGFSRARIIAGMRRVFIDGLRSNSRD